MHTKWEYNPIQLGKILKSNWLITLQYPISEMAILDSITKKRGLLPHIRCSRGHGPVTRFLGMPGMCLLRLSLVFTVVVACVTRGRAEAVWCLGLLLAEPKLGDFISIILITGHHSCIIAHSRNAVHGTKHKKHNHGYCLCFLHYHQYHKKSMTLFFEPPLGK